MLLGSRYRLGDASERPSGVWRPQDLSGEIAVKDYASVDIETIMNSIRTPTSSGSGLQATVRELILYSLFVDTPPSFERTVLLGCLGYIDDSPRSISEYFFDLGALLCLFMILSIPEEERCNSATKCDDFWAWIHVIYNVHGAFWQLFVLFQVSLKSIDRRMGRANHAFFFSLRSATFAFMSMAPWPGTVAQMLRPEVPNGHTRLSWTCHCGAELYGDFVNSDEDTLTKLHKTLDHRLHQKEANTDRPRGEQNETASGGRLSLGNPNGRGERSDRSRNAFEMSRDGFSEENNSNDPHPRTSNLANGTLSSLVPKYIELCVNTGRMCQSLGEIDVSDVWTDVQLFRLIRTRYKEIRSWRTKRNFFLRPSAMDFVGFFLENKQKVHISQPGSFPLEEDISRGEYLYAPCPMESPPPMPSSAFIHWLHYCDLDQEPMQRTWLDRLPKKLNEALENSNEPLPEAWGMHVVEGADTGAMLWAMILTILTSVGPLAAYIVVTKDVQSAMAVGSIVLSIVALLYYCMQVDIARNK